MLCILLTSLVVVILRLLFCITGGDGPSEVVSDWMFSTRRESFKIEMSIFCRFHVLGGHETIGS
jgi:hypothetical protein